MLKTVGNPSTRYGNQTIVDGNLIIGTSGKGIDFSAGPNAPGATSELLDDYETGTWTPTIAAGATGITYNSQLGVYVKIGRLVYVRFGLNADFTSNGASGYIGGLPFTNSSEGGNGAYLPPGLAAGNATPGLSFVLTTPGAATLFFSAPGTGVDVVFTGGSGKSIEGTAVYIV